ncbi:hypothetical protein SAMN05192583_1023 [Sphingomonas gellani]|uniref:Uncharacterized protein n=1 Tax=Sphingomonas gellani TaxID=1166340 RepID=A0A1H8ARB0_9SPHN|nr:hypothetical protein [Sphingomonas gellani]SEM73103.1 hypothetical protein SAMN05192583_1023 [Sphingomonas gellani]
MGGINDEGARRRGASKDTPRIQPTGVVQFLLTDRGGHNQVVSVLVPHGRREVLNVEFTLDDFYAFAACAAEVSSSIQNDLKNGTNSGQRGH